MNMSGDTGTSADDAAVVDDDQTTSADVNTDVDTDDDDDVFDEEAAFAEIAEARSKGTRFDAMGGDKDDDPDADTDPDKDGGSKEKGEGDGNKGKDDGESEGADKGGKQDDSDKPTEADKGGDKPDSRDDSTAQPPAQPPASVAFQPGAQYEDIREDLLKSIGDIEVEPADGDNPAMTFKEFEEDFPGVTRAIVAISGALNAGTHNYVAQMQAKEGRAALMAEVSKEVDNAAEILASPEFTDWFDKQPDAVKELGYSSGKTEAVKLLRLFGAEKPGAVKSKTAATKKTDDPKAEEEKRKRLGVLQAGSVASRSKGGGREHVSDTAPLTIDGKDFIDDDEADRIFNEFATKKDK